MEISTIGLDLAKSIFQVHGVARDGTVVVRKALRRSQMLPFFSKLPPCLIGMEACATAHHWARELGSLGHDIRLMPAAYVKPYVKRGKNDANDAEAICEAVTRPTMRFVAVKSPDQQAGLAIHRIRDLLVKQRTQLVNMIRGQLAEFGIDIARGLHHAMRFINKVLAGDVAALPVLAMELIQGLAEQVLALQGRIAQVEKQMLGWFRQSDLAQRLATIPGIGIIGATAFVAAIGEPGQFRSGRQFAAWLGLTPMQNSSGGKEKLGRISKMGNRHLRRLLIIGMTSRIHWAKRKPQDTDPWLRTLVERKPVRVASVALANKSARIVWAIMAHGGSYRKPQVLEAA
jgi:transposase